MKKYLQIIFILTILSSTIYSDDYSDILIEAESFNQKGGWLVDPQFVEQMGSPYLLAHGLGSPVKNAKTEIQFPSDGEYHIWVRTKNWVAGDWSPPGQFKLIVNQNELAYTLGTGSNEEWTWQYAGKIYINNSTVTTIELKDLTGFEGRCDAIYFSTKYQSPPNEENSLKQWRNQFTKSINDISIDQYDLIVVGGGIAGCAAAIAAAQQGLEVALIHDRPVLGGNSSSEIRVHTEGITWHSKNILSKINTEHWTNGSPLSKEDDTKRLNNIKQYNNIHLFLQWRAYNAINKNDSIDEIYAKHTETGEIKRFKAPLYVDSTGDGWIGYWAGAEIMYGRESSYKYNEDWDKYGELWSPDNSDNKILGSSIIWRTTYTDSKIDFPSVPWAMDVAKDYEATQGSWHWEFSQDNLHQIDDAEFIRDHMFRAIYGSFFNVKQKQEYEKLKLEWVSYLVGKRESRRIVGDYIFTFNDIRNSVNFPDTVVMEKRPVDVHFQQNINDPSRPDFLSEALFYKVNHYHIPYRSLYSKNIDNLFMAGRCFSCSHIGLCGPRVMNTTGQMGVAVGFAASLCKKYNTSPRGIYQNHIEELKSLIYNSYTKNDYNANGISDIFWRNRDRGTNHLWLLTQNMSPKFIPQSTKPSEYKIAGTGDFNGDGITDIFWRKGANNYLWLMKKDGSHRYVLQSNKPVEYKVAGIGDFNGDGIDDIFWRRGTSNSLWLMKKKGGYNYILQSSKSLQYKIAGIGDFNGDGIDDIFWKNGTGNSLWYMKEDGSHKYKLESKKPLTYQVAGIGDFNGDGIDDIFWKNGTGNSLWYMKKNGGHKYKLESGKPLDYQVAKIGDFNGDGIDDILWRNKNSNSFWFMKENGGHKYRKIKNKSSNFKAF